MDSFEWPSELVWNLSKLFARVKSWGNCGSILNSEDGFKR